jgi:small-conductance mechanosensitive channel
VHQLETSEDVDGGELTSAGDDSKNRFEQQVSFEIKKDPRSSATREDLQVQFEFLVSVRDKLTEVHESIKRIRDIQDQLKALKGRLDSKHSDHKSIIESADKLIAQLEKVEKRLYQTKNQSPQDPLNFPIRLNNRLSSLVGVASMGDNRPTRQAEEVRQELVAEIDALLSQQSELIRDGVEEFNKAVQSAGIPAIFAGPVE